MINVTKISLSVLLFVLAARSGEAADKGSVIFFMREKDNRSQAGGAAVRTNQECGDWL